MDNQKRNAPKALTTDEIRTQAQNWNLAGDAGLLAHLEQFSENILQRTQETQTSLNELLNSFEETSVIVSNVTNQFLALQNSQFVENRVYDDETPTEEKKLQFKVTDPEEKERLILARYREAVEVGIKLLDTHFEKVQLPPSSDSDDEDTSQGNTDLVWRPKNPYADKPFPLLIGSAEWWADDHVGLGDYEENVDSERILSESDSEMETDRHIEKRVRMSSSSSTESEANATKKSKIPDNSSGCEDLFLPCQQDLFDTSPGLFGKVGSQLFDKTESGLFDKEEPDLFGKDEPGLFGRPEKIFEEKTLNLNEEDIFGTKKPGAEKLAVHPRIGSESLFQDKDDEDGKDDDEPFLCGLASVKPTKQNAFTKELAAKLGNVANKQKTKPEPPEKPQSKGSKPGSRLFPEKKENGGQDEDEVEDEDRGRDQDGLFISSSGPVLKKLNLFADTESEQLFGKGSKLFGGSTGLFSEDEGSSLFQDDLLPGFKNSVKNPSPVAEARTSKSDPSSNLFDGVEDDVSFLSAKSVRSKDLSGRFPGTKEAQSAVKFSTPTDIQAGLQLPPEEDLFGSISAIGIHDASSTGESSGSLNAAVLMDDETSKDLGFGDSIVGDSSKNSKSQAEVSDLFQPEFSSTRRISADTSDYRTQRMFSKNETLPKSDSPAVPASDEGSKNRMGHSEKHHFPRSRQKSFDNDDDLFSSSSPARSFKAKEGTLFEDLFSNSGLTRGNLDLFGEKKSDNLSSKAETAAEEEDGLFVESSKQDAVSISSSRSSLFDEVSLGKSTLPSIFDKEKPQKVCDDVFDSSESGLFGGSKKSSIIFEDASDDLFSSGSGFSPRVDKKNKGSLFGEDEDDLFGPTQRGPLFGEPKMIAKNVERKTETTKQKTNAFGEEEESEKTAAKKMEKLEGNLFAEKRKNEKLETDLFGGSEKSENTVAGKIGKAKTNLVGDSKENKISVVKKLEKPKTSLFGENKNEKIKILKTGLFGENEKDDDLFGENTKPKQTAKSDLDSQDLFRGGKMQLKSSSKASESLFGEAEEDDLFGTLEKAKNLVQQKVSAVSEGRGNDVAKEKVKPVAREPLGYFDDVIAKKSVSEEKETAAGKRSSEKVQDKKSFPEQTEGKDSSEATYRQKPEPPKTLDIKKKISLPKDKKAEVSEPDGSALSSVKPKKIGKLNIPTDLKINPVALLPGAKNVKPKATATEEKQEKKEEEVKERVENSRKELPTLGAPAEAPSNLLKCTSKDRVKVPARRRPQSRRARQEALRSSGIDFGSGDADADVVDACANRSKSVDNFDNLNEANGPLPSLPTATKSKSDSHVAKDVALVKGAELTPGEFRENAESSGSIFHSVENSPDTLFSSPLASNPLSPSTDEEDYFNVPELDVNFEKEDQSIFKSHLKDFKNENREENLLFDGAPVLSPLDPDKKLADSLANTAKENASVGKMADLFSRNSKSVDDTKKHKIFQDEDDDNDDSLFQKSSESSGSQKECLAENKITPEDEDYLLFFQNKGGKLQSGDASKKSLFDEEESDDLFSSPSNSATNASKFSRERVRKNAATKPKPVDKALDKTLDKTIDKNTESFVDPLGLISNTN